MSGCLSIKLYSQGNSLERRNLGQHLKEGEEISHLHLKPEEEHSRQKGQEVQGAEVGMC